MAQAAEVLTDRQRQTLPARQALNAKFETPQQRSDHFRELGRKSAEGRILLSADESAALVSAYDLLTRIAERARLKLATAPNGSE